MAGSLGKAYVQIVPSAEGIKGALEEVLGGPLKNTGIKAGSTLSKSLGSGLTKVGSSMTNYITKPAMAAVTALGGATLFSGWKRMTEIDNAKVKLQAIGNTAKDMERITASALESVKDTAYGMNEAMTASASAVAAGIKPGEDLTKYLTAISDAAAVAGTDMTSMGAIFNKVATSGKAQNDVLSQMADAGIPIYQYLADEMGVTADKVFDLAKSGEVGLSDFQNAVTNHIGGAAKEIGSGTITGAIANIKASISRIGANFLGSADDADSFAGKILPMLNSLMDNLEPVEEKAKELGSEFADGFEKFADVLSQIPLTVLAGIGGALVSIGPALKIVGTVMTMIGPATTALTTALGAPLAGAIMSVAGVIAGLATGFALVYANSESFRNAVGDLVKQLVPIFIPVVQTVIGFLKELISEVVSVARAIGDALAPVINVLTPVVVRLAQAFGVKLKLALKVVMVAVKTVANAIKLVAAIVQGVFTAIKKVISSAAGPIKKAASNIKDVLSFKGIVGVVQGIFNKAKNAILQPIEAAKNKIKGIIDAIKGFFRFSVSAPHIPLPHFSLSPAGWKIGDLVKGKIPSLSVSWYQKAEKDPYMFTKGTLFGAGEHNDEILYGRRKLMNDIKMAVGSGNTGNTFNVTMNVSGAEDPERWADKFMSRLKMEARMA